VIIADDMPVNDVLPESLQSRHPQTARMVSGTIERYIKEVSAMSFWVSAISILFAALAAVFWAWSSLVNVPMIGSGWGTLVNTGPFYAALTTIARLNTAAAACEHAHCGKGITDSGSGRRGTVWHNVCLINSSEARDKMLRAETSSWGHT
jgi:hypothetical protein